MHCHQVMFAKELAAATTTQPNTILSQWLCGAYATNPDRVLAIDEKVTEFFEAAVPQHARTLPPSASLTLSVGPSAHGGGVVISAQLGLLRQAVHARLESASEEAIASAIDRPAVILQCWLRDEWGDVSAASRVSCILALEHDLRRWLAGTYVSGIQCRHCGLFGGSSMGSLLSHEKACVRAPSSVRQANAAPTLPHHVEREHTPVIVGGGSGVDSSVGSGIGFVGGGSGVSSSVCSGSGSGAGASSASGVGCSSGRDGAAPGPEHAALVQRLARHKQATGLSQARLRRWWALTVRGTSVDGSMTTSRCLMWRGGTTSLSGHSWARTAQTQLTSHPPCASRSGPQIGGTRARWSTARNGRRGPTAQMARCPIRPKPRVLRLLWWQPPHRRAGASACS